ncbi:hypothetical protein QUF74_08855 [Candidatus Halobeggiatoa sp. HSG11]|nr:hypothetical protein [Candidatus Halobeggiatoa sp. HSG11]
MFKDVIIGCSVYSQCTLLTADKQILKLKDLDVLSYDVLPFMQ